MKCAAVALLLVITSIASAAPFLSSQDIAGDQLPFPRLSVAARVESDPARENLPLKISGTVSYFLPSDSEPVLSSSSICYYLPYNNAGGLQPKGTSRKFEYLTEKTSRRRLIGGNTAVELFIAPGNREPKSSASIEFLNSHLVKVTTADQEIKLNFTSLVPRPASFSKDDFLVEGFYPTPLIHCPDPTLDSSYYQQSTNDISGSVYYPDGWQFIGPGSVSSTAAQIRLRARGFGFFLARGLKMSVVRAEEPKVRIWYRTDDIAEMNETLAHALDVQERIFGKFPFPTLDLVESSESENPTLPGLMSINRPRQEILRSLQSEWLNWRQWVITAFTANQWYGQSISTDSPDDGWLLDGISDYATLETLSASKLRYNLFKTFRKGFHIFSFNYLQIQELVASSLRRNAPSTRLTNSEYLSLNPVSQTHPLSFVRHALALRQLKSQVGDHALASWFKQITKRNEHHTISPQRFMRALGGIPSPFSPAQRKDLTNYLVQWWTSDGWPDFTLGKTSYTQLDDGKWATRVNIRQSGKIKVPTKVLFVDGSGADLVANSELVQNEKGDVGNKVDVQDDDITAQAVTNFKPTEIVIDPDHEIYDANRYDNKSSLTALKFFPGNARTLADDEYTLIWAPYAFRHPGEPVSVGLQGVLFKYLQGSTRMRIENYPANGRGAGFLHHISDFPDQKTNVQFLLQQHYSQDRVGQLSISRSPFLLEAPLLNLGTKLRYRENIDEPESSHTTVALNGNLKQVGAVGRVTNSKLSAETEHAPKTSSRNFNYIRNTASADISLVVSRRSNIEFSLRGFYGDLTKQGKAPSGASFRINSLDESRVRIDSSLLPLASSIESLSGELSFPLFIPMPWNSLILSRNIRWRSFYDYGYSPDLNGVFRASGLGLDVPFGGDIMGAGSLTFTKLSVLAVLYTSTPGKVSRRPTFLFDITGEL